MSPKGFTLFEVLIALAIGAIAMGALFEAVGTGTQAAHAAGRYEEAISRARSHLAAINRDASALVGVKDGDDGNGYQWHLDVVPVADEGVAGTGSTVLYQVVVSISWREALKTHSVTLETRRLGVVHRE